MIKPRSAPGNVLLFYGQVDHGTGGVQFVQDTAVTVIRTECMRGWASYKIA